MGHRTACSPTGERRWAPRLRAMLERNESSGHSAFRTQAYKKEFVHAVWFRPSCWCLLGSFPPRGHLAMQADCLQREVAWQVLGPDGATQHRPLLTAPTQGAPISTQKWEELATNPTDFEEINHKSCSFWPFSEKLCYQTSANRSPARALIPSHTSDSCHSSPSVLTLSLT